MAIDPRRRRGELGERIAEEHLEHRGYRILARNFRTRFGELDLVAADERTLVFGEVKTRLSSSSRGPAGPLAAIGLRKRDTVRGVASEQVGAKGVRGSGGWPCSGWLRPLAPTAHAQRTCATTRSA